MKTIVRKGGKFYKKAMSKGKKNIAFVSFITSLGYVIGCTCLYLISLWIFGAAIWKIGTDVVTNKFSVYNLLDEVGMIVFAIAVIDVCKYLLIEEVCKDSETRKPFEVRKTLTKFIIIIVTAVALKGLVLTIKAATTDITTLFYPISLFAIVALLLVGLGIYQRLNTLSEEPWEKNNH